MHGWLGVNEDKGLCGLPRMSLFIVSPNMRRSKRSQRKNMEVPSRGASVSERGICLSPEYKEVIGIGLDGWDHHNNLVESMRRQTRSEERRVGKECRSGWSPYH